MTGCVEAADNIYEGASGLYRSIGSLVEKLDVVKEVGDKIANVSTLVETAVHRLTSKTQIHPYLNVAWQVATGLYRVSVHIGS